MSFFTQKLRTFAVVAVGLVALLLGSCAIAPTGSKRPLGPPADVATHAPELIGMWERTQQGCGSEGFNMRIFKTDGFGADVSEDGCCDVMDRGWEWKTDGSVLFNITAERVWGDYVVSENTLRIKYANSDCTEEYRLISSDTNYKYRIIREWDNSRNISVIKEIKWEKD
jgi:hypothetical protein